MSGPSLAQRSGFERIEREREVVALGHRDDDASDAVRAEDRRNPGRRGLATFDRQGAAQKRSPGSMDRDLVSETAELGRRLLHGRSDEQGVRPAALPNAARGADRRLGHRIDGRVQADDQRGRILSSPRQDRSPVARAQIEHDAFGTSDQ